MRRKEREREREVRGSTDGERNGVVFVYMCADEEIAQVTEFFEGSFERYFNLFLPCVVSTPWNPSFTCCANLNQIWGAYEEVRP